MPLTFGFNSIRDLLAKLERDAKALDEDEVTGDRFLSFVLTGYSMIDWVKKDPSVPASAKQPSVVQALYADQWLKVCGDLATAVKHFTLTSRVPITNSTKLEDGFGVGGFGKAGYGVGEKSIEITLNDGTKFNGLDLVRGVLTTWKSFFRAHQI
ncbi:MAG: hypothetical protein ACREC3_12520 [Methyloceanibacter sp.]